MFRDVLKTVGELVGSGLDAAKAGIGSLLGDSKEAPEIPVKGDESVNFDTVQDTDVNMEPLRGLDAHVELPQDLDIHVELSQDLDAHVELSQDLDAHLELSQDLDVHLEPPKDLTHLDPGDHKPEVNSNPTQGEKTGATPSLWEKGVFQRGNQIGFYDFTTDPNVCGFFLDPKNRWVELREELFVSTPEMMALEVEYHKLAKAVAAQTPEQKYVKKITDLIESEKTEGYSKQLDFEALTNAHQKYSSESPQSGDKKSSAAGRNPIPFQLALGSLIVQSIMNTSDRGTGKLMSENPFIQYFCGYTSFSVDNKISHSKLSELKEVFDAKFMKKINETFLTMKIENIHLEAVRNAEQDVEKATKAFEKATAAVEKAKEAARKAVEELEEVKAMLPGTATDELVKAAEKKVAAAQEGVKKAQKRAQKAQEKLTAAKTKKEETEKEMDLAEEISEKAEKVANAGCLSIDATANPGYLKYPQDYDLLNDARKLVDRVLSGICHMTGTKKPRTDKKALQKEVKNLSKKKRKKEEDIRPVIKDLLQSIKHIFDHIDKICKETGYELTINEAYALRVVKTVYGQQCYMYENKVKSVPHRIVSLSMPQVRPIVRGKVNDNVEFGPKTEVSVDANHFVRLENFSFEAFNEGTRLKDALERYKKRNGYYPEVVRCDQIYRSRENYAFCKERGIRMSGPRLGRKPKDEQKLREQIALEEADMVKRIEVEREISREKGCWGTGCIMERTPVRMEHACSIAVFLSNLVPKGFLTD